VSKDKILVHAMKVHWESTGIGPLQFNLGPAWRCVWWALCSSRFSLGNTCSVIKQKTEWDFDILEKGKISSPSEFEPPIVQSLA